MTANEVIKSLEKCSTANDCKGCPSYCHSASCIRELMKSALDLIHRQRIEIDIIIRKKEALKDEVSELQAEIEGLKEIIKEMTEERK